MNRLLRLVVFCAMPATAFAAWPIDPAVNVPVSRAAGEKYDVFAVSDGCGGAIVAWEDERGGASDIYAQRVDVTGRVLWQTDGVPVCTATGNQGLYHSSTGTTGFTPVLADGEGGAWIVWQDERAFASRARDVYLQRLDADGRPLFAANGLAVAARAGMEDQPTLCADGAGGVFVVWQDKNANPVFYDLHGQCVGPDGELLWNGGQPKPLVVVDWDQDGPALCPDGEGGCYLAWSDGRDDVGDVYAQRLDASGNPRWQANGRAIATGEDGQDAVVLVAGSDGLPLLAWVDRRSGTPDIYAQKLAANDGAPLWTAGGRAVCTATESQYRPALGSDGEGGAYVAWFDYRNASGPPWNLDIYVQRILAGGNPAWIANGVAVCSAPGPQRDAGLVAVPGGGVYVAWEDDRANTGLEDIYAQRVSPAGTPAWTPNGVAVSLAARNQNRPQPVLGAAGLLLAWPDDRDVLYENDVYAGRVLEHPSAIGANRVAFDFGGTTGVDTFQVGNVGNEPVTVLSVALAAPGGPFDVVSSVPTPVVLVAGETFDVVVSFAPGRGRADVAGEVVVIHDAAFPAEPLRVALRGQMDTTPVADVPTPAPLTLAAWPNPFNPAVTLSYRLRQATVVTLRIHDLAGRCVRALVNGEVQAAGSHDLTWNGRDDLGRSLPSGTYLARIAADGAVSVRAITQVE